MAASGLLDPTKTGKYPVILSDALLGKPSKETYTGIRYNHRPTLSSDTAPNAVRLKKSAKDDSYNLGFDDQGDKYQYNGVRTTDDGNYVLIFDPARKAFVLHRVDSTFHMNITRTPIDSSAESLRKQYPPLEVKTPASKLPKGRAGPKAGANKNTSAKAKGGGKNAANVPKSKDKDKGLALTLPDLNAPSKQPEPSASQSEPDKKPKRPTLSPVESEEEEDDDDDGGLTVEYPDGNPVTFSSGLTVEYPESNPAFGGPSSSSSYMPSIPVVTRRFSEFAVERESEEDDFDTDTKMTHGGGYEMEAPEEEGYEEEGEEEEEEEQTSRGTFQSLAKPFGTEAAPKAIEPERYTFDNGEESDADGNDELDGELEAELEREFEKIQNSGHDSDSSVSEEE